jgi:predicted amidohydrolase YtcJ
MRTLLVNGRIHSPWARQATAILVDGSDVAWIGDDASAETVSAERTVDLSGALVIPGFVDAHFHATDTGLALTGLDLSATATLGAALDLVEVHARRSGGRALLGGGWDETRWPEGRAPTSRELDRASYGGVVYLARTDGHSAVASSALMAAVPGISGLAGYRTDGLLAEKAHHAARALALAAITRSRRVELQRRALQHAASLGVVSVHEMAGPEVSSADDLGELLTLAGAEPVPEVLGYWGELDGVAAAQQLGAIGAGGDLFCDGSIGSHTAGLTASYADAESRGYLRYEVADLARHIEACTRAGIQAGFHAIGDAAVGQVIEAMAEAAAGMEPGRVSGAGHRIEHAELIPSIVGLAESGLLASVQPAFDATWGGTSGMYAQRLGAARASELNPFSQLAAAGVPLAFGSDSPVTPVDPWGAIRAAVHPTNPTHAMSPRAAFSAHTRGGWRAARADGDGAGVLAPGAPASFAIFEAGEVGVEVPDERLSRWSTDERAAVPGLPDLSAGAPTPRCLRTVHRGVQLFDSGELG